jgi:hypothetical protein
MSWVLSREDRSPAPSIIKYLNYENVYGLTSVAVILQIQHNRDFYEQLRNYQVLNVDTVPQSERMMGIASQSAGS